VTGRLLLIGAVSAALAHSGYSFVVSRTAQGSVRKWDLVTLNANVHTNVVNRDTRAIRYFLASDAYSGTNTAAELTALRASFDQWQLVPGTSLRFEDAGLIAPVSDINTNDNTNVVFFAKTTTLVNGGQTDIRGRPGAAFVRTLADGTIAEADIVLNAVDYEWFTDFTSTNTTKQFIEATALHQIGRLLGLAPTPIGGATMMWTRDKGITPAAGLSADEIAAARALYPTTNQTAALGAVRGTVTKNGGLVLGAVAILETADGNNVAAAAVTSALGFYEISAVPPGSYHLRVVPFDPNGSADALLRGTNISSDLAAADTGFLPTTNYPVTLAAGMTNTLNIAVQSGTPAFRIAYIREPTTTSGSYHYSGFPAFLRPGQSNWTFGVGSPNLPASGSTLSVTGDGVTIGPPIHLNIGAQNFVSARVSIASNATPGLRSIVVQKGTNVAYANGFLEILPLVADHDFDGLSDKFQRQYFSRFTLPQADPGADPDGDGFINRFEAGAGTNPTNNVSFLKIDSVTHTMAGTTVTWRSVPTRTYQLYYQPALGGGPWTAAGAPITATGDITQRLDPAGLTGARFYVVGALP
jgi:hypothetical protein